MHRLIRHLRSNVVAYLALCFAIGGGGGYAIAATTSKSVHACVVTRTGELLVKSKCSRGQKALVWNKAGIRGATGAPGPAGAAGEDAVVAIGDVATNGVADDLQGMTITQTSTGVFTVTVTAAACSGPNASQVPVVSPLGDAAPGEPQVVTGTSPGSDSFLVYAGEVINGTYTPGNQGFTVQDACT